MFGHSFGAYTTLVVSGARPALDWLEPSVEPGKGLGPDLRDPRVTCSVALSPQSPGGPFFYKESFGYLRIPIMGVSGTKDKDLSGDRPPQSRYQAFSLWPANNGANKYVWLNNASHLDFADGRGSGRGEFHSSNREDVQPLVRAATLFFFNEHLKNDDTADEKLTSQGLQLYLSGNMDGVEVRAK
jgi:predicted dienelactone hydrolase